MTYLAASMCPGEELAQYCAMMLVIVERSGLVWVASQLRLPMYSWRVLFSLARSLLVMSMCGIESTGNPLRYGVSAECVCGKWRLALAMRS